MSIATHPVSAIRFLEDRAALCADALQHCIALTQAAHYHHRDNNLHWSDCPHANCQTTSRLLNKAAHGLPE